MSIQTRYGSLADRIEKACLSAGRDPREVTFVAVSKTVGPDEVAQAFSAGARNFGENRPEGLLEKAPRFNDATWHFIGNIQSRRIGDIVAHADLVHSLYQARHADKIDLRTHDHGPSGGSKRCPGELRGLARASRQTQNRPSRVRRPLFHA